MMTVTTELQEDWSQVVFIDPLPTCQPILVPFLETIAIGEGFALRATESGQWETNRNGFFIGTFSQRAMERERKAKEAKDAMPQVR